MSYRIPIGPYHLALEEPYKIEVECEGETVVGASLKVGFNFRGIEWLAQHKNITKTIALVERVCGICSNVHSMTFCMALERIGEIEVPEKAKYVRVAIAELERLHSHLLCAGGACARSGGLRLRRHAGAGECDGPRQFGLTVLQAADSRNQYQYDKAEAE